MNQTNLVLLGTATILLAILFARQWKSSVLDKTQDENRMSVSQFVGDLSRELETMERQRIKEKRASAMSIESFDLELNFTVRSKRGTSIEGGYDKLLVIKTERGADSENVHKIVLHMKPRGPREGIVGPEGDHAHE